MGTSTITAVTDKPAMSADAVSEASNLIELAQRAASRADLLYRGVVEPDADLAMFALVAADAIHAPESGTPLEEGIGEDIGYMAATLRVLTRR